MADTVTSISGTNTSKEKGSANSAYELIAIMERSDTRSPIYRSAKASLSQRKLATDEVARALESNRIDVRNIGIDQIGTYMSRFNNYDLIFYAERKKTGSAEYNSAISELKGRRLEPVEVARALESNCKEIRDIARKMGTH